MAGGMNQMDKTEGDEEEKKSVFNALLEEWTWGQVSIFIIDLWGQVMICVVLAKCMSYFMTEGLGPS